MNHDLAKYFSASVKFSKTSDLNHNKVVTFKISPRKFQHNLSEMFQDLQTEEFD
jgi:hypothetical protein